MMGEMHSGWSTDMGTGMGFGMWAFWIVVIVVVALVFKLLTGNTFGQSGTPTESALEILRKRYARGEIDGHEFERMKKELEK